MIFILQYLGKSIFEKDFSKGFSTTTFARGFWGSFFGMTKNMICFRWFFSEPPSSDAQVWDKWDVQANIADTCGYYVLA